MELILEDVRSVTLNVPKLTRPTFEMKNNYYVVTDGSTFNYYPIKTVGNTESSPLIRFEKSPPVLLEGVAIVDKKVYRVTLQDLLRRIIRKSREVKQEVTNGNSKLDSRTKSDAVGTEPDSDKAVSNQNKPGVIPETEVEKHEIVDSAWEEQIGALLNFISEKEGGEWEITEAP